MTSLYFDDINGVISSLRTDQKSGLFRDEAKRRLKSSGRNMIVGGRKTPTVFKFLKQFTDILAIILLIASVLALLLGAPKDAVIIFLIVLANGTIGFIQEHKADRAIDALKKYTAETSIVIRDGGKESINAEEIVPGDIVELSEGMKVPADIRLLSANELMTNDAALTGESEPQRKLAVKVEDHKKNIIDISGSVFMGTNILSGNGVGVCVATGMETHFGKIAKATSDQKIVKSPLQIEVDKIGKTVARATFWVILVLLGIYTIIHGKVDVRGSFEFAIGVASSLVPEGLPATVSIALAIGVQKMARRKAAIRRLSAVETLGEANYIITDKTGTLTKNQMTVKEFYFGKENYHLKGVGYALSGEVTCEGRLCNREKLNSLRPLFEAVSIANHGEVDTKNHEKPELLGDSMELALLVAAEKAGVDTYSLRREVTEIEEIPFTSERKYLAKAVTLKRKKNVYVKGATNVVLSKCTKILINGKVHPLTESLKRNILRKNDEYCREALRVISAAYKPMDKSAIDKGLIFLGLFGIIDPPREDAAETIRLAKNAGIKIIMATGDYGLTAAAIGRRIKLSEDPEIVTGDDLSDINDKELYEIIANKEVIFSRVDPIHKLRLVKVLQAHGNIVAVTGDGVNDAPALKTSNIGVAMGISGTDVTKEAAEMVSLNDSFSSIVWAIKEGRLVYENIRKVTKYVFTSNLAEFTAITIGLAIGIPPIFAIQILLVDLGAEVFPALALAGDTEEDDLMQKPPRDKNDVLFGKDTITYILRSGILMGMLATFGFCIFGYANGWRLGGAFPDSTVYAAATTVTYATLALCQYVNALSIRSQKKPIWKLLESRRVWTSLGVSFIFINSLIYIPFMEDFAGMKSINLTAWGIAASFAAAYGIMLEFSKIFNRPPKKITAAITQNLIS